MRQCSKARSVLEVDAAAAGRSHTRLFDSYLLRIFCMVAVIGVLSPSVVWSAEEAGDGKLPDHHLALFAGGGVEAESGESSRAGFAFAFIYEYRFHEHWGIGAVADALGQNTIRDSAVVVPVSYHLTEQWRLFAGPGVEFSDHGDEFLVRVGVSYEIPLADKWTIGPEFAADFVNGGKKVFIGGVSVGYEF